ncbi:MAG: Asp-tRNA(Asn)/Glu-tRNA(Gln) amidotransferase subunit GatC [Desulfovibrio sp.]|jgi:aspartyl-tRNA(Asn)/glutamyl-tRNA(Gln) amidotransferase subunit C|nr:Asp-tRNA(Asn)/Glu-tRNA(Gln) amidotransferase subunit GatC [Desulfovibrio sp.]
MPDGKTITKDDVARMAALSRLTVNNEEGLLFTRQFQDILGYMDVLAEVDTTGVEPLYSPILHKPQCREDSAARLRTREEILANAPEQDGACFIVPRIVQAAKP